MASTSHQYVFLKSISLQVLVFAIIYCSFPAYSQEIRESNGLLEIKSNVDLAFMRPGVDWTKYRAINLKALVIPPSVQDATPPGADFPNRPGESWLIKDEDVGLMKKEFARVVLGEIRRNGAFEVVTQSGSDTIVVLPQLLDIYLTARPQRGSSRNQSISDLSGSLKIAVSLADGETGEIIARAIDERHPMRMWRENSRMRNIQDMNLIFRIWGGQLRNRLLELASGEEPNFKE